MDGTDILPDDPDEEELDRGKEEDPYDDRRHAHGKGIPEEQLGNEISHCN